MTRRNAPGGYGLRALHSVLDAWQRPLVSITLTVLLLLAALLWPLDAPTLAPASVDAPTVEAGL